MLLGSLKLGKVLTTGGTMLLSALVYATVFGWRYAVGVVGLIFIHEMGHYIAARQRGLEVGAPTFIPFVGAWIEMKDLPHDAETEAHVGLGGPLLGTVGAFGCYVVGQHFQQPLWLALAYVGFLLNLFNLIPVSPFDGGRITAVLSPRIWFLGVPVLIALFALRPSPILILVAFLAAPQLMKAWRYDPQAPENRAYYGVTNTVRWQYATWYIGLAACLAVMMEVTHGQLQGVIQ